MKILIIDDHNLYLEGVRAVLSQLFPNCQLFLANTINDAFSLLTANNDIDIILLDLRMPNGGAPTLLSELKKKRFAIPILIVSASENSADIQMVIKLGVSGYLPKTSTSTELKLAIDTILDGEEYLPEGWGDFLTKTQKVTSQNGLQQISVSPRLNEVLQLIEKGCTTAEIGNLMTLSEHTVKGYVKELFSRFDVHNRTELIQIARQLHFFSLS